MDIMVADELVDETPDTGTGDVALDAVPSVELDQCALGARPNETAPVQETTWPRKMNTFTRKWCAAYYCNGAKVEGVARHMDDEDVPESPVEDALCRHTGVGTTRNGDDGRLLREPRPALEGARRGGPPP